MKFPALGLLAFAAVLLACEAADAGDPTGLWQSESGLSRYQVRHCGRGICVQIDWIIEGPGVRDEHNPDPNKRSRRVMGIEIVTNARPAGEDQWTGRIYNFKDGRTYSFAARLLDRDRLQFQACGFGGVICLTQSLSRLK